MPLRLIGVAGVRISAAASVGNGAVWLELLVTAFESEENCMGYVQNPGTLCPELGVPKNCCLWLRSLDHFSLVGLLGYSVSYPLSRFSGYAHGDTCFGRDTSQVPVAERGWHRVVPNLHNCW